MYYYCTFQILGPSNGTALFFIEHDDDEVGGDDLYSTTWGVRRFYRLEGSWLRGRRRESTNSYVV